MTQTICENLISISAMMMLARERAEFIKLTGELNTVIETAMQIETLHSLPQPQRKTLSTTVKFTTRRLIIC